jgi:class 3 adenylate cyclase
VAAVPTRAHTFLFADLAGFTALTETHGDEHAADLVGDFCAAVRAILGDHGAVEVKQIGDALMLRVDDPTEAVALGLRIVHEIGSRHGFPTVRVGMHTGPAVERGSDWFGTTVNVAARVSAIAGGGEVLLTEATAGGLGRASRPRAPPLQERRRTGRGLRCGEPWAEVAAGPRGRSRLPDGRRGEACGRHADPRGR